MARVVSVFVSELLASLDPLGGCAGCFLVTASPGLDWECARVYGADQFLSVCLALGPGGSFFKANIAKGDFQRAL
jgi:hypothetical protein